MSMSAIQWRWPGARCIVRDGDVVRWDGPMARPTDTEIAQAVTDYQAVAEDVERESAVTQALDGERLISAVVWAVIDTYSAPATPAKYRAARTKIIAAYKGRPWV